MPNAILDGTRRAPSDTDSRNAELSPVTLGNSGLLRMGISFHTVTRPRVPASRNCPVLQRRPPDRPTPGVVTKATTNSRRQPLDSIGWFLHPQCGPQGEPARPGPARSANRPAARIGPQRESARSATGPQPTPIPPPPRTSSARRRDPRGGRSETPAGAGCRARCPRSPPPAVPRRGVGGGSRAPGRAAVYRTRRAIAPLTARIPLPPPPPTTADPPRNPRGDGNGTPVGAGRRARRLDRVLLRFLLRVFLPVFLPVLLPVFLEAPPQGVAGGLRAPRRGGVLYRAAEAAPEVAHEAAPEAARPGHTLGVSSVQW